MFFNQGIFSVRSDSDCDCALPYRGERLSYQLESLFRSAVGFISVRNELLFSEVTDIPRMSVSKHNLV